MTRIIVISITVLLLAAAVYSYSVLGRDDGPQPLTAVAQQGDFELFVRANGSIVATRSIRITCPLSWRAITLIAPEGSQVKKGDVVVEFEREDLEEEVIEDVNKYRVKAAKLKEMEQTLTAERRRIESEISTAKADLKIKQLELENLLKQPRPHDLKRAEIELRRTSAVLATAKAEQDRANDTDFRSLMLASELRSIENRYIKALKDHDVATTTLKLLRMGPDAFPDEVERARLEVKQAETELQRAQKELPQKVEQLTASIESACADVERRKVILAGSKKDLEDAVIKSPVDGMVVYRTVHGRKLSRGDKAWRGASLIDLPELSSMSLRAKVRESDIQQVKVGSICRIFIDAIPGKQFTGTVSDIGTIAKDSSVTETISSTDLRRDTGIKVFEVTISLDEGHDLFRPNLVGRAEILTGTVSDAVSIPIDAVHERDGGKYAYVKDGSRPKPVAVDQGKSQDDRVIIRKGLAKGDEVYIVLPPETGLVAGMRAFFNNVKDWVATPGEPEKQEPAPEPHPKKRPRRPRGRRSGARPGGGGRQ